MLDYTSRCTLILGNPKKKKKKKKEEEKKKRKEKKGETKQKNPTNNTHLSVKVSRALIHILCQEFTTENKNNADTYEL